MGIHAGSRPYTLTEDNIQGLDGYVGITDNDNVRTLGLQNFYGHVWDFLDNVIGHSASNKVWIKKDLIKTDTWPTYSNLISNGWEELEVPLPGFFSHTWVSELSWNFNEPWALCPSKFGGNDVEPIGDCFWNEGQDPFSIVSVGGDAWYGYNDGALCWASRHSLFQEHEASSSRSLEIVL